jgi:hypothetical protein
MVKRNIFIYLIRACLKTLKPTSNKEKVSKLGGSNACNILLVELAANIP